MKISEGMRMGIVGKKQIKGKWFDRGNGVCAIGALVLLFPAPQRNICDVFPTLREPFEGCANRFLINEIAARNDDGQTFEQIIEWLESIGQ